MQEPIPVSILAGFLGSGKTTLLNRILRDQHGLRLAVLVNDFGAIDIDAKLLEDYTPGHLISLPNGCICCTLFTNLSEVLRRLTSIADAPDHILIEASGVSAPDQIVSVVAVAGLEKQLKLNSVIVVADATRVQRLARAVMFIERQLRTADIVLLNKTDLVEADEVERLKAWIRDVAPGARVISTSFALAPLDLLLGSSDLATRQPALHHHDNSHHDHGQDYATWSYSGDRPLLFDALEETLNGLPPSILRGKGLVNLADRPERRTILQMVGQRIEFSPGRPWQDDPRRTDLVFIGEPDALTDKDLQVLLDACIAP